MTVREMKIAAVSASLAAFLGVGASKTIAGAAPAELRGQTLRIFRATVPGNAGPVEGLAFEVCASAVVPGNDAGALEVVAEQGCESAPVPAAMAAKVDALLVAAAAYWKNARGL